MHFRKSLCIRKVSERTLSGNKNFLISIQIVIIVLIAFLSNFRLYLIKNCDIKNNLITIAQYESIPLNCFIRRDVDGLAQEVEYFGCFEFKK